MGSFFRKEIDGKLLYNASYYSARGAADSQRSAEAVVPVVMSLVEVGSVVDVGCGAGGWLGAFRKQGVERILGLDGEHVDPAWLQIPPECFRAIDLSRPFQLDEQFDLAVCLEVAEHLPKKCAAGFVRSLVRLAPVVLFSAAVPSQGGTHHVNERWPGYWQGLFAEHGYRMLDVIRKEIWKRAEIQFWYRQNVFLFVREDLIPKQPAFQEAIGYADDLVLLHRDILANHMGLGWGLGRLQRRVWRGATRRLKASLFSAVARRT